MKASTDPVLFNQAWQETPFSAPQIRTNGGEVRGPSSAREAFAIVGCHVKSRELADDKRWPRYFGRLASYSERVDHVIVISKAPSHGIDGKPTVWSGTFAEYSKMWECD
jgi:hypothetical protein